MRIKLLLIFFLFPISGEAFPIWGLCLKRQDICFKPNWQKTRCTKNHPKKYVVKMTKKIVVRIYNLDKKCVWVYTGPKIFLGLDTPLTCIPQEDCEPLLGDKDESI